MSSPRVSVCIRTKDRPELLREALASVLAQDFVDFEVIVSTDGPPVDDVVAAFADPRVRTTRPNGPPSPTGNLLHVFGEARGELLALLDDDDAWEPGFLAALVPRFDLDPQVGVVFCDYAMVTGNGTVARPWPFATGVQDDILVALLDRSIPPAAALLRRTAWESGERVLPLTPDLAGAASIWLRTASAGWRFDHVSRTLVRYRMHPHQMSWTTATVTMRWARTLERLRFDDEAAERLRRARLTEAHLTQCGIALRRGDLGQARGALRAARGHGQLLNLRNAIAVSGIRRLAARRLPEHPRVLAVLVPVWQRLRPRPG